MPQPIRVLHVDDEPDFADLTATYLERENDRFAVQTATSASEGLTSVKEEPPDCIVSDHNMPGQSGIEFLESIRGEWPDLPFILFTGKGTEEVASDAISAGVTDYLQKTGGTDQYAVLANRIENAVDRVRTEQQQERQLEQAETIFESAQDSLFIIDVSEEFTIERVNPAYEDATGLSNEEIAGGTPREIIGEDQGADIEQKYYECVERRTTLKYEETLTIDGDQTYWETRIAPVVNDGEVEKIVGATRNITDQKEREQELRRQTNLFDEVQEIADIGAWSYDVRAEESFLSKKGYEIHGLSPDAEMTPEQSIEFYHPDDQPVIREAFNQVVQDGEPYDLELRLIDADGTQRWVRTSGAPRVESGSVTHVYGALRDITDRKEREQELREERAFIDQSLNALEDVFYVFDADREILRWNDRLSEVTGYADEEIAGREPTDFFPEDHQPRIAEAVTEVMEMGSATVQADFLTADGERIPHEFTGFRLTDPNGVVLGFAGIGRDLTDLRERERQLEQTQRRMELALEATGAVVWEWNPETDRVENYPSPNPILDANIETVEAFRSYVHPEDRAEFEETLNTTFETGDPYDIEFRVLSGGELRWVQDHGDIFVPEGGTERLVIGVLTDITDHKRRERRLTRQNERLDKFVSIVSHDLRSPLMVANGQLELARDECDSEHLARVDSALNRMDTLIEDLLALAREGEEVTDPDSVDLAEIAESCWTNVDTRSATLVSDVDRTIYAEEGRLKQVFENLIRNAIEHGADDVTVTIGDLDDGFYIEDDGPGVPENEREEIFEAGYSTSDQGTGFGLSIVKQVAEAHNWEVFVTEGSEGGTRFEVTGVTDAAR